MAISQNTRSLPNAGRSPEFDAALDDVDLFARLIALPRHSIEVIVEAAIAHLDVIDGNPDDEDTDDDRGELDHLDDDGALDRHRHRFTAVSRRIQ